MRLLILRLSALVLFLLGLIGWPFIFGKYTGNNAGDFVRFIFAGYAGEGASAFLSVGLMGTGGLLVFAAIVAAIAWIPWSRKRVEQSAAKLKQLSQARPIICSIIVGACSTAYLALTAVTSHRHLYPAMHDEFSYLIQARQLASGHLWMPAHPLAPFFDSFQLLVQPVYASAYFPGTSLLYVPGIWLQMPPFVTSLIICGVIAALLFFITNELIGGIAGWLAVLLLWADIVFRQLSVMVLAQLPLLMYALAAIAVWLSWRKRGRVQSAVLIGFFLGLAVITRPVDALCFGLPIGIAMLFHRRRAALVYVVAGTLPLLMLQLILDRGITGHWLQTPFGLYADRDYPGTTYGFHRFDPEAHPVSDLPQKQLLFSKYIPLIKRHTPGNVLRDLYLYRLRRTLAQQSPVPYPLLILLSPLAVLGITRTRAVVLASLPLWLTLYAAYVFFMPHYVVVAAPAVILAIVLAAHAVPNHTGRHRRFAAVALSLFIACDALASLPQWTVPDHDVFGATLLSSVNAALATLPHKPAVVLFTFDPNRNLDEEPVYNDNVAWPDDAMVIRAHDRGVQNADIFKYYAERQPLRDFYRFDEATGKLTRLGISN